MRRYSSFEITVTNWENHNPNAKKYHKHSYIDNNFCTDGKLLLLTQSAHLFYLFLILTCGEMAQKSVTVSQRMCNVVLRGGRRTYDVLDELESFHLVTYQKTPLIRQIDLNDRKKKKENKNLEENTLIKNQASDSFLKENEIIKNPISETLDPYSDLANKHARFVEGAGEWIKFLEDHKLQRFTRKLAVVRYHFSSLTEFDEWLDHVTNTEVGKNLEGVKLQGYVAKSLDKKLGLEL